MSDTLFADVSEWNAVVGDGYPYQVLSIRSNDGTWQDKHFLANYAWSRRALDSGQLQALIIYLVYRQNWQADFDTMRSMVGAPVGRTAIMLDVESWGGQITGDQSSGINGMRDLCAGWLGDPRRVLGYANMGDLAALWPSRPAGQRLIIAAYGTNPDAPGKLAHQFTDGRVGGPLAVPPFGQVDVNSADGYGIADFCAALGFDGSAAPPAPPPPPPVPGPGVLPECCFGDKSAAVSSLQGWGNGEFGAYWRLPVTGYYGPMTQQAVAEFQRRAGIVGGDGRNLGPQTRAKLWAYGWRG